MPFSAAWRCPRDVVIPYIPALERIEIALARHVCPFIFISRRGWERVLYDVKIIQTILLSEPSL